jgi:ubiquinone/menaquinone biosynthesis C-methylase UbiE
MTDEREKVERYWNRLADYYDRLVEREYSRSYKRFRKIFFKYVKRKHKVLDVATGTGDIAFVIAKRAKDVTGVDIASGMITEAKKKAGKNPEFLVDDVHDMDFERSTFDLVTCCNALNIFKDMGKALKEIRRVMKAGGKLVTITYCYGDASLGHLLHLYGLMFRVGRPRNWRNLKGKALRKMHTDAGFKVLKAEYCWKDPPAVIIVARK